MRIQKFICCLSVARYVLDKMYHFILENIIFSWGNSTAVYLYRKYMGIISNICFDNHIISRLVDCFNLKPYKINYIFYNEYLI